MMELNDPAMEPNVAQSSQSADNTVSAEMKQNEQAEKAEEILTENAEAFADSVAEVEQEAVITDALQPEFKSYEEIIEAARQLADRDPSEIERVEVSRLRQHFLALEKKDNDKALEQFVADGGNAEDFTPAENPLEAQFKEILNTIKDKKAAFIAEQNAQKEKNLAEKKKIIAEILTLAEDTDNVNKTFPTYRELQDKFNAIGDVPPTDETAIWKEYQDARERYSDNLKINKELRDYDFKKNLEQKEEIVKEAVELAKHEDVVSAFKRLQDLHLSWREIGPVAKELRDEIWNRFKEASTEINKRYQVFFEERKAKELENEKAKTEICERVEALDFSSLNTFAAWDEMTTQIITAQEDWRKLGFASRKMNNALFNRFRATCDTFFALKAAYYKGIKDQLAENLAKKTALVEKAEALMDSTDWKNTTETLVALQKEWKTIGTVAKKHSDAIWKRFQTACDTFFENKKKETSSSRLTEHANLQAKRDLIKELDNITDETPKHEASALINDLRERWKSIGHVPFREKDKVYEAFKNRIDEVRKKFDLRDMRERQNRFEDNLAAMEGDDNKIARERDRMLRILETRRAELRTYENNLGFLNAKSKSGNSLVKDFEKKIERLKEDISTLEGQIKQLESKL
ncbi:MAG: DUF349 domain-containing protein [Muribaculaceae bacterium]|nr:DUF349 domain-containing protein [Muribaculaceae bacterium]